jgi:hypothetical protein
MPGPSLSTHIFKFTGNQAGDARRLDARSQQTSPRIVRLIGNLRQGICSHPKSDEPAVEEM